MSDLGALYDLLTAGTTQIGTVGKKAVLVADETTRPADVLAYTAGDGIAAAVTDSGTTPLRALNVGRVAGGSGRLIKFRLMTDQVGCVAIVRLHLYNVAAPTGAIPGDNVQLTMLYANKADRIGQIDFPALATSTVATSSTAASAQVIDKILEFKCLSANTNIYYRLETLTVFTPASAQKFYLEVVAEQD